jgi:ElaB/YqjD/DUF883 family membrane-anchored ribosome-binding protein
MPSVTNPPRGDTAASSAIPSVETLASVAQRSQEIVEESIQRNPVIYVGAALAAGVVLGWLVKRN